MKWDIFKILQMLCWLATVGLLVLGLVKPDWLKDERDIYIGLIGCTSVAAIACSELVEQKIEKFSAANAIAVGYIKNYIEPIMASQLAQYNDPKTKTPVKNTYIFIPDSMAGTSLTKMQGELAQAGLKCTEIKVPVNFRTRPDMDITELVKPPATNTCYFNLPNTFSSLEAYIEHRHRKKISRNPGKKAELEKKYLQIFKKDAEDILEDLGLDKYVKVVHSVEGLL